MFFRRYTGVTSDETIVQTSQVAIVELDPAGAATGVRKGYPLVVFEPVDDQGMAVPAALVTSRAELRRDWGSASPYIGAAADGYSGNLDVQSEGIDHLFPCIVVPVDAEAGEVTFARPAPGTATILSGNGNYELGDGDNLNVIVDGGAPQVVTWNAARASYAGAGATWAACVNLHHLDLKVDGVTLDPIVTDGSHNTEVEWLALLSFMPGGGANSDGAGVLTLFSDTWGTSSSIEVLATSSADVLAALGLVAGSAAGTGDVANLGGVTPAEVAARINADTAGCTATVVGSAVSLSTDTAGAGGSIRVTAGAPNANAIIGFSTALVTGGTGTAPASHIPAGTRVRDAAGNRTWLTLEDVDAIAGDLSETVRVRAASGTSGTSGVGAIGTVVDTLDDTTWTVSNALAVTAANLDNAYIAAIQNVVANPSQQYTRRASYFAACRHTADVMYALTTAAASRSSAGRGALAIVAPPVGTAQATAEGSGTVGVSSALAGGRSDRRIYAWPGVQKRSAVTGSVVVSDFPSDLTLVGLFGQLDPEESPGQLMPDFMTHVIGLEAVAPAGADVYADYASLKAVGICAPRVDPDQGAFFQDDVTSSLVSGKTQIPRRTMVDFIGDSIGAKLMRFKGQPFRDSVREDAHGEVDRFLAKLVADQRIYAYTLSDVTTGADRAAGILRLSIVVDLLGNIGSVKVELAAGPGILELAEAA